MFVRCKNMFTIGRQREKEHSHQFVKSQEEAFRLDAVIDAVHDMLDGAVRAEDTIPVFVEAFTNGGSGVWEQAGSWLRKLSEEHPILGHLWREFCRHRSVRVRFRAATFLEDMPTEVFAECFPLLLADASAKVRAKVASGCYRCSKREIRDILATRLSVETDERVKKSIRFAMTYENP